MQFCSFYEFEWQVPHDHGIHLDASGAEDFVTRGKWGTSQTPGTPGGTVTWSLAGAGLSATNFGFYSGTSVSLDSFLGFDYLALLHAAFGAWSSVANINFVRVADGGGSLGTGTVANIRIAGGFIDGSSNVLARAYFPNQGAASGDMVFDSGETSFWTANSFLAVATHEIGHSIGLDHTSVSNQLMNAFYNPNIRTPQSDDIAGARFLYGTNDVSFRINDITIIEGDFGFSTMTFTVSRTSPGPAATLAFQTNDGDARAGLDYVAQSGTVSFVAGETFRTIAITVNNDTRFEPDKWFTVSLSNPTNGATISDAIGIGIIRNNDPAFIGPNLWLAAFGTAGSWTSDDLTPRRMADVNGDGFDDILGFAHSGVVVSLATGGGNFGAARQVVEGFGVNGSWTSSNITPRMVADVNGDGRADILGFGSAGVYVSLATGGGSFGAAQLAVTGFGINGGWANNSITPRAMADVNGDGMADIVGFGSAGVFVSLATGGGNFGAARLAVTGFGTNGGWTNDNAMPRRLADVNGDGMADIVAFGSAGVFVSLATGGGSFGAASLKLGFFGSNNAAGGWSSNNLAPRELGDVNGDGLDDIVGFGGAGAYVSLATGGGNFGAPALQLSGFGSNVAAGAWSNDNTYPRLLADANGDGLTDLVGFGIAGVYLGFSNYPL